MGCLIGKKRKNKKRLGAELSRRSKVGASGIKWVVDEGIFYKKLRSSYIFILSFHFPGLFPLCHLE